MKRRTARTLQERTNISAVAASASKGLGYTFPSNKELLITILTDDQHEERHANLQPTVTSRCAEAPIDTTFHTMVYPHPPLDDSSVLVPPNPRILALEEAINLLKTHAKEARDNITNLRVLLAQRDTEPAIYRSLQRQRWVEERRELKVNQALQSTYIGISAIIDDSPVTSQSKDRSRLLGTQNLEQFFEITKQRVPNTVSLTPRHQVLQPSRVHHHSDLLPLQLVANYNQLERSKSTLTTGYSSSIESTSSEPPPTPILKSEPILIATSTLATKPHSAAIPPLKLSPNFEGSGIITIYHSQSNARIPLEHVVDTEVSLPDYVAELMSEFDSVALQPLSMSNSNIMNPELGVQASRPSSHPPSSLQRQIHKVSSNKRINRFFSKIPNTFSSHSHVEGGEAAKRRSAASVSSLALSVNEEGNGRPSTDRKVASRLRKRISALTK